MNEHIELLCTRYPALRILETQLYRSLELLCDCFDAGGKLLLCGNGGSAADCAHIVGELMKGFLLRRPLDDGDRALFDDLGDAAKHIPDRLQNGFPAISLCEASALLSAFSNDVDPEMVYAQQVWVLSQNSPDLLVALSTSGNSANVVNAVRTANALGIDTIGITGAGGGALRSLCTECICLPETETFKVQELTLPVYHALCAALESEYFES
ncbi:MAG: SIS domain-containing protein [Clostridia bacterium]|nr:SIS domain-containing protein [Clostridia bacterium]